MTILEPGDLAPDFELETDGGGTVRLSDLRDKRVVLYFYPKDNTPGCTKQACGFRDRQDEFAEMDVVVLGVSPDGVRSHDRFRDRYELNFPLLSDPDHAVAEAYGAWGPKKLYGKEYMGLIRSTFVIGPDGKIERVYSKVKAADNPRQVLEDLSA